MKEIYPVAWRFRHTSSGDIWHVTNREPLGLPATYTVQPLYTINDAQVLADEKRLRNTVRKQPEPPPPEPQRRQSVVPAELYRPKDAMKLLGIGRSTFYKFINEGRLKTVKLSERSVAVRREELQRFMDSLK